MKLVYGGRGITLASRCAKGVECDPKIPPFGLQTLTTRVNNYQLAVSGGGDQRVPVGASGRYVKVAIMKAELGWVPTPVSQT